MTVARLLVTGAGGQVGTELCRQGPAAGFEIAGAGHGALDITDPAAVTAAVEGVDAVINAAAYTAVDRAESERDQAFAVNAAGPLHLARACAGRGVPLIHISTDFVFAGDRAGRWREDDPVAPINVYGASKAAGEEAVRATCPDHVIIRTSWVFSAHGQNFVRTMLRVGAERETLRVVDDQQGLPTFAGDLAAALLAIAAALCRGEPERIGTYHYANAGATTWWGFAEAIIAAAAGVWGRRPQVVPIASRDYPTPAQRPANSVLDCSRIEAAFGLARRPWRQPLDEVVAALLTSPPDPRS